MKANRTFSQEIVRQIRFQETIRQRHFDKYVEKMNAIDAKISDLKKVHKMAVATETEGK